MEGGSGEGVSVVRIYLKLLHPMLKVLVFTASNHVLNIYAMLSKTSLKTI